MTVTGTYQAFSFTSVRLSIAQGQPAAATPAATSQTPNAADTVSLSPGATTAAASDPVPADPPGGDNPAVPADPPPPSRAQRRADALFGALDADQDGAITEQEFTDGAAALLRRAGDRHRLRSHDGDHRARGTDGKERASRLEQKLEEAFAKVDANQDGAIDKDELTSALAKVAGRKQGRNGGGAAEPAPAPPPEDAAPASAAGSTMTFSFTYVSVAVQRYTALQAPTDTAA